MKLGFRHGTFQTENQAVVEQAWMINSIAIADERMGQATEIEQTVPVGIIARQS